MLQPSDDRPELAQLAVSPTGRAAHVYLLPGEGERAEPGAVAERLAEIEGVDLVCTLLTPERRAAAATGAGDAGRGRRVGAGRAWGEALRFRPGDDVADLRGARWQIDGELSALGSNLDDGRLSSENYPDPLARVWSALTAPHSGDFIVSLEAGFEAVDWGGVTHAGGG